MPERIIAEVREYFELIDALRLRSQEIKVTSLSIEEVAGIPAGFFNKCVAAKPVKHLGAKSLGPILGALGLKLAVIVDEPQFEKIQHRLEPSKYPDRSHSATVLVRLSEAHMRKIQRKGGQNSRKYMTREAVRELHSRIGKAGAAARWAARRRKPAA